MEVVHRRKGNDIAVRRFASSTRRQPCFHKKTFAKENVANAAEVAIDAFLLAQQMKNKKKGIIFFLLPQLFTYTGMTEAWCLPGRQLATYCSKGQTLLAMALPPAGNVWASLGARV